MNPKRKIGRPRAGSTVKLTIWVMVELLRDKRDPTKTRDSVRRACDRLESHLAESFQGGHAVKFEGIREHYKDFERAARRSNSGLEMAQARSLLENARLTRELCGWKCSTWALVLDSTQLPALGYDLSTDGDFSTHELSLAPRIRFTRRC
jgi:hypothetical protein